MQMSLGVMNADERVIIWIMTRKRRKNTPPEVQPECFPLGHQTKVIHERREQGDTSPRVVTRGSFRGVWDGSQLIESLSHYIETLHVDSTT